MDVITCIAKDPALPDGNGAPYAFSPEYFAFQPKLHEYLREMRSKCFDGRDCMCVGEASFVNTGNAGTLVGDGTELDLIFQFDLMDMDGRNGNKWDPIPFDLMRFKKIIDEWQQAIDWNTLFLGNHDQPRIVSRFGNTGTEELRIRSAKCLAAAMYLLRGTPFIYQGEELGMANFPFEDEAQLRDVESINWLNRNRDNKEWAWRGIRAKGRDNARTPMQWNRAEYGGFSTVKPWIDVNPDYRMVNAEAEDKDENSVLNFYRSLIKLRNSSEVLKSGTFKLLYPEHGQLFAYERCHEGKSVRVVCNLSGQNCGLPEKITGKVLLGNCEPTEILPPYGAVVFEGN